MTYERPGPAPRKKVSAQAVLDRAQYEIGNRWNYVAREDESETILAALRLLARAERVGSVAIATAMRGMRGQAVSQEDYDSGIAFLDDLAALLERDGGVADATRYCNGCGEVARAPHRVGCVWEKAFVFCRCMNLAKRCPNNHFEDTLTPRPERA